MSGALVVPFPPIGPLMEQAYYDLYRAETAKKPAEVADLGPLDQLPRPWDLATITDPALRAETWDWLDAVVGWINQEYVWETSDLIPPCWPSHPHLVNELGVVADQRRRATMAFTSDSLLDWHRYCLPSFIERMKARYRGICEDGHRTAPGTARNTRYGNPLAAHDRNDLYLADIMAAAQDAPAPSLTPPVAKPRFQVIDGMLVDTTTGQIADDPDQ